MAHNGQPVLSAIDETAIRDQLERIVSSPGFAASKKYPALLRYVVEGTLAGRGDHLKERSIGVEAFGRVLEYDTNQDPVVRTTAAEVRRRLALYYHSNVEDQNVRIELPVGSYVPEFTVNRLWPKLDAQPKPGVHLRSSHAAWYVAGSVLVLALVGALLLFGLPQTPRDRFWMPVLQSKAVPVICVSAFPRPPQSSPAAASRPAPSPTGSGSLLFARVSYSDVRALVDITGVFREKRKPFIVRSVLWTNLHDLRGQPVIVIGAFNNSWTRQLLEDLRFGFRRDNSADTSWISDSKEPANRRWQIVDTTATTTAPEDYAIIARLRHPLTEQTVIVAAGLTQFGTAAAGECLRTDSCLEEIDRRAEDGWERKSLEVVIGTRIVRSEAGPARVLATHVW